MLIHSRQDLEGPLLQKPLRDVYIGHNIGWPHKNKRKYFWLSISTSIEKGNPHTSIYGVTMANICIYGFEIIIY